MVKKFWRNKILCQTTLLFAFDDETNHFSCYKSKRISKAEQQLRNHLELAVTIFSWDK